MFIELQQCFHRLEEAEHCLKCSCKFVSAKSVKHAIWACIHAYEWNIWMKTHIISFAFPLTFLLEKTVLIAWDIYKNIYKYANIINSLNVISYRIKGSCSESMLRVIKLEIVIVPESTVSKITFGKEKSNYASIMSYRSTKYIFLIGVRCHWRGCGWV